MSMLGSAAGEWDQVAALQPCRSAVEVLVMIEEPSKCGSEISRLIGTKHSETDREHPAGALASSPVSQLIYGMPSPR